MKVSKEKLIFNCGLLIVSIPDLCILTYFDVLCPSQHFFSHVKRFDCGLCIIQRIKWYAITSYICKYILFSVICTDFINSRLSKTSVEIIFGLINFIKTLKNRSHCLHADVIPFS